MTEQQTYQLTLDEYEALLHASLAALGMSIFCATTEDDIGAATISTAFTNEIVGQLVAAMQRYPELKAAWTPTKQKLEALTDALRANFGGELPL